MNFGTVWRLQYFTAGTFYTANNDPWAATVTFGRAWKPCDPSPYVFPGCEELNAERSCYICEVNHCMHHRKPFQSQISFSFTLNQLRVKTKEQRLIHILLVLLADRCGDACPRSTQGFWDDIWIFHRMIKNTQDSSINYWLTAWFSTELLSST